MSCYVKLFVFVVFLCFLICHYNTKKVKKKKWCQWIFVTEFSILCSEACSKSAQFLLTPDYQKSGTSGSKVLSNGIGKGIVLRRPFSQSKFLSGLWSYIFHSISIIVFPRKKKHPLWFIGKKNFTRTCYSIYICKIQLQ